MWTWLNWLGVGSSCVIWYKLCLGSLIWQLACLVILLVRMLDFMKYWHSRLIHELFQFNQDLPNLFILQIQFSIPSASRPSRWCVSSFAVFQPRLHFILSSHLDLGVLKMCFSAVFGQEASVENQNIFAHCLTRPEIMIIFPFITYQQ
jgi:hypothetical protein